jgi:hypothetical protein
MVGNFDSDIYGGAEKGGDGYATELVDEGDTAADVPEATAETRRRLPSAETSYFSGPTMSADEVHLLRTVSTREDKEHWRQQFW